MTKSLKASVVAGLSAGLIALSGFVAPQAHAAANWECTPGKCTQIKNEGSYNVGIVFGFGDIYAYHCFETGQATDCRKQWLAPGARTSSSWDADTVIVKSSCRLYTKVKYGAGPTEYYWSEQTRPFKTSSKYKYFKYSGDATVKSSC